LDIERVGEILALLGLGLVLLCTMGRRRARQEKKESEGAFGLWVKYGDFVAFGVMLAGLVLMGVAKK
jgi:hypothetical protein